MRGIARAIGAVLTIAGGILPGESLAAAPGDEILFVANAEGGDVSLIDVRTRKVIATIDSNPNDTKVARPGTPNYAQDTDVSLDGRTLFVSRGYMGDVAAFDIASGKLAWQRSLNTVRADHMTITPDGRWLFVSALVDHRVDRLDAKTGQLAGSFISGVYPHDNQITEDGKQVINSSLGDMTVPLATRDSVVPSEKSGFAYQLTVADVDSLKVTRRIRMPVGVRPWHMKHGGDVFYAQTSNHHSITAFSYPDGKALQRIDLPVANGVSDADYDFEAPHHGLALSADGSTLCVAGRASDYAALVSAPSLQLIATIPVGDAPGWAVLADDDRVCVVANTRDDTVSFVSVAEKKELARVRAGDGPKHLTVARVPADVLNAARARTR